MRLWDARHIKRYYDVWFKIKMFSFAVVAVIVVAVVVVAVDVVDDVHRR